LTQARLTEAQKLSLLGAWEWDTQTDALWMSDQFCKNIGLSEGASCSGRQLFAQIHEDDQELVRSQFADAENSGNTIEVQHRFHRFGTNEERIFTVRARTHNTLNSRWIFVCSSQDITDQQHEREERQRFQDQMTQMQRLESLGILAGGVAHDFNNLLTGILGNASLAREFLPPESEIQEFLRPIEKSAEHAAQLCHQMLTYAGRGQDLQYLPIDLDSIIADSTDLIKLAASRKSNLKIQHDRSLPFIDGDAGQIRQILLNLVQNAAEAFPPSGGDLVIRTGTSERAEVPTEDTSSTGLPPDGQVVWVEVSDNGQGMSEATRERIFEPFFTTKFTGRGLGLSTVHGIVRGHNAMMTVTSRPQAGTTFRILFPVSVTQNPGMMVSSSRTPLPIEWEATRRGKALIVDDDSTIRSIAAFSLAGLGFSIEEASDGQMAIDQFTQAPASYSVVVLDLMMPLRDGREVLTAIREYRQDIAVIIISGYSEMELTDLPIGPSLSFLQKPFKAMDLSILVRRTFMTSHDAEVSYQR
jgi:two-component system, cell cycle sensor histidine kinase and response regulator CckA